MPKLDNRDFEERYNACFVDFGIKIATGVLIGSLLGGFFLRGYKKWPTYIGGGLGFGMAYSNCENSLNSFLLSMDPKACIINFRLQLYEPQIQNQFCIHVTQTSRRRRLIRLNQLIRNNLTNKLRYIYNKVF